jgi:hypothetical protein
LWSTVQFSKKFENLIRNLAATTNKIKNIRF